MGYLAGGPSQNVARVTVEAAATASQTIISVPGGFVPGYCDVFVGGACLSGSKGDYDDSDGASVKLVKPMAAGTQYRVVAYNPLNALTLNPANYVQKAGDTMSGALKVNPPSGFSGFGFEINSPAYASIKLNAAMGSGMGFQTLINNVVRWTLNPGDGTAETGSNAGNNFTISAFSDTGAFLSAPLTIKRATGRVLVNTVTDDGVNQLQVSGFARASGFNASTVSGNYRAFYLNTNNSNRWALACSSAAESGSNAGSDFVLDSFTDTGAWLRNAFAITRSNGYVTITGGLGLNSTLVVAGGTTFNGMAMCQGPNNGYYNGCPLYINGQASAYASIGFGAKNQTTGQQLRFNGNTGYLESIGWDGQNFAPLAASAFQVNSDAALKENVTSFTDVLPMLRNKRVVRYNLKADESKTPQLGMIAQEWQEAFPELIDEGPPINADGKIIPPQYDADGVELDEPMAGSRPMLMFNYGASAAVALQGVIELDCALKELKAQLDAALNRIAVLEGETS